MPSNSTAIMDDDEKAARAAHLESLGLDARLSATASASQKSTSALLSALTSAGLTPSTRDALKASLAYTASTKLTSTVGKHGRTLLYEAIGDSRLKDTPHVEAAAAWLVRYYGDAGGAGGGGNDTKIRTDDVQVPLALFEEAAGVGVDITHDDMRRAVDSAIGDVQDELLSKRYRFNTGLLQRRIMEQLRFADGSVVNRLLREKVEQLLGPKTEADLKKPSKTKKKDKPAKKSPETSDNNNNVIEANPLDAIPSRFEARGLTSAENTAELLAKQREHTNGKVVTRFPPEPNGYLHVGHAKAMFLDFGYAVKTGGDCVLRMDDTNPSVEKQEYVEGIVDMVHWMGHKPCRITYSSQYFDQLFSLAVELIRRDKAYVCEQTAEQMGKDRRDGIESPYRSRSVADNERLFWDMRKGKFGEGEATLRMKIDMQHANMAMRDPVAYRVLHQPHERTGDKWCIYPSYDYTHCIVDSLEWITHSICTLEFEIRRDSYYWLLEALDLYRPFVWECARLNVEHTVMSKRKLKQLVEGGHVRGWDDARMPTLMGMRRRGYPASAIQKFCAAVGVSRSNNVIGMHVLEHWVRTELNTTSRRLFGVLNPLRVRIANFRGREDLDVSLHPGDSTMGSRVMTLTETVYIERDDFRMEDCKGYFGLAPGKSGMLRHAFPIQVVGVVGGESVEELVVEMDYDKKSKPKGVFHWVGSDAKCMQARLYKPLFKSAEPGGGGKAEDWLDDLDQSSEIVLTDSLVEPAGAKLQVGDTVQFERCGYFTVDPDSTAERPVFNRTVSLRESK